MSQSTDSAHKIEHIRTLAQKASEGDKGAFEEIYTVFLPKLSRFVSFRVNHRETAEDLIAEIFVKVWNNLQKEPPPISFANWIFTIARNRIIDHYRTQKSFSNLFDLENFLEYEDNVVDSIDLGIAAKEFLAVVGELTEDQQQVLRLKFFEDLDNEEPSGTIRVIQHRAIVQVKRLIQVKKKANKKTK
jgi:RNA polymerase sigma-70 factor, ECF subfamily